MPKRLCRVVYPLALNEIFTQQPHAGLSQFRLAVVTAAEENHDQRNIAARLNEITQQFVPVPPQSLRVCSRGKETIASPIILGTFRFRIVGHIQAMPEVTTQAYVERSSTLPSRANQKLAVRAVDHPRGSTVNAKKSSFVASLASNRVPTWRRSPALFALVCTGLVWQRFPGSVHRSIDGDGFQYFPE